MIIYIVMGHTNTWEDAQDWVAKCFKEEEDAISFMNELNEYTKKASSYDFKIAETANQQIKNLDPYMINMGNIRYDYQIYNVN